MNKVMTVLLAAGAGAALMYILDPQAGNRRRALARDKMTKTWRKTTESADKLGTDISNRARGAFSAAKSRVGQSEVSDQVLVERVRSKLGRYVSHPGGIEVTTQNGRVTLRGHILADEVVEAVAAAWSVEGVADIDNQLTEHTEPGNVPELQGEGKRPGAAWGFLRYNWSPTHRLIAGTTGTALFTMGARRRTNPLAVAAGLAGLLFAMRGLTNRELRRMAHFRNGRQWMRKATETGQQTPEAVKG